MTRLLNTITTGTMKATALLWLLLQAVPSTGQVSKDLNRHIKTNEPTEAIVYTALKKGYVSLKAEIQLINGELKALDNQSFEDFYLKPLSDRCAEKGGRVYEGYSGLFYLFIKIKGNEPTTLEALEETLIPYADLIAGFKWNQQRNPLKVVLIDSSPALAEEINAKTSSLISLEGDYSFSDQGVHHLKMPVVGLNYEVMDAESLRTAVKTLHRQGKKLRLYNVPRDQRLWKSLMHSGVDFINTKKSQAILAKTQ